MASFAGCSGLSTGHLGLFLSGFGIVSGLLVVVLHGCNGCYQLGLAGSVRWGC